MGLSWSMPSILQQISLKAVPSSPGLYKILNDQTKALLYIGESENLRNRLTAHTGKIWGRIFPYVSYVQLPDTCLAYQRHECENDLIGAYYAVTKQVPLFQFLNHR
jgi:GIY-YIG catalytic domain